MGHGGKECSIVVDVGIKTVKIEGIHLNQPRNERVDACTMFISRGKS